MIWKVSVHMEEDTDLDLLRCVLQTVTGVPDRVVVAAVSGGRDSMVLLHLLATLRREVDFPLYVCHVHHGLRGAEADRDAHFVQEQAAQYGVPAILQYVDVARRRSVGGGSEETVARELRYEALRKVADGLGRCVIMTAHHQGDQAETVLSHLVRGSGLHGLRGMDEGRPFGDHELSRPLLGVSPERLQRHAERHGVAFVEDSTNQSLNHRRNRIRRELIPYIERHFNRDVVRALARLAVIARGEDDMQQRLAQDWLERARAFRAPGLAAWGSEEFLVLPDALQRRVLKLVLERLAAHLDWNFEQIEQVRELAAALRSGHAELRGAVAASNAGGHLVLRALPARAKGDDAWPEVALACPGTTRIAPVGWMFVVTRASFPESPDPGPVSKWTTWLPFRVGESAVVRPARRAQRVRPAGMSGSRLVSDVLADAKVPRAFRSLYPLVALREEVLWLPGLCRAAGHGLQPGEAGWKVEIHAPPFHEI